MTISVVATGARLIAGGAGARWITLRVLSGSLRLGDAPQTLANGDGLPVTVADGALSLAWSGEVWVIADAPGPASVVIFV